MDITLDTKITETHPATWWHETLFYIPGADEIIEQLGFAADDTVHDAVSMWIVENHPPGATVGELLTSALEEISDPSSRQALQAAFDAAPEVIAEKRGQRLLEEDEVYTDPMARGTGHE